MIELVEKQVGKKTRTLFVCRDEEVKERLRALARDLAKWKTPDSYGRNHAYLPDRSVVTHALCHIGYRFTLNLDLADWFNSTTLVSASGKESNIVIGEIDSILSSAGVGVYGQGLPCSPICVVRRFNLEYVPLLKPAILDLPISWTAYADDLAFSFDDPGLVPVIKDAVRETLRQFSDTCLSGTEWRINERKTRLQDARYRRRVICGISVGDWSDEEPLKLPKRVRHRLRGLERRAKDEHDPEFAGLSGWAQMIQKHAWLVKAFRGDGSLAARYLEDHNWRDRLVTQHGTTVVRLAEEIGYCALNRAKVVAALRGDGVRLEEILRDVKSKGMGANRA